MTRRTKHALQAAISTAIIAWATVFLLAHGSRDSLLALPMAAVIFALTFYLWKWAFRPDEARLWRAVLIGALIVLFASFALMMTMAVSSFETLEDFGTIPLKAAFFTLAVGIFFTPIGIIGAVAIRSIQVRSYTAADDGQTIDGC